MAQEGLVQIIFIVNDHIVSAGSARSKCLTEIPLESHNEELGLGGLVK